MTTKIGYLYDPATPVRIPLDDMAIEGDLQIPKDPPGLVIFFHGSGSGRFSPRNRHVAGELNRRGLATLLLDLLTEEEHQIDSETMKYRFDIPLLADRSIRAANWVRHQPLLNSLPIGLFGASTGAAAALVTAAGMKDRIACVVSRGGRPDLATDFLGRVECPTLLVVGGEDETVLSLNKQAMAQMRCMTELHVVAGATHLFEEPGALEDVATVAAEWFTQHMDKAASRRRTRASLGRGRI